MGVSKITLNGATQIDLTADTVAANKLLYGETATGADGNPVTGSIATKTSSDMTVSGSNVTAPAGYYASAATKSVSTTTHPSPTVAINAAGTVTATHTQYTGYVTGSTTTGTLQLTTKAATTVTPTTSEQTVVAAGVYTTGAIKVSAMSTTSRGTPTISVDNDTGVVTAAVEQGAGYIATGGTTSVTHQIPVSPNSGQRITPDTTIQVAIGKGQFATDNILVDNMPTASQAVPIISVDSSTGEISVTATQAAGYVAAGTASATSQLTTQGATTVTPSSSTQTVVAAGTFCTGAVTVSPIPAEYVPEVLYTSNNSTGINTTVTLSKSAANYSYIEIFFTGENGTDHTSVKVHSPNGKNVALQMVTPTSATVTTIRRTRVAVSGTSITPATTTAGYIRIDSGTVTHNGAGTNYIYIYRVIGFK